MTDTDSYVWKSIFPQSPRNRPCHRSKQAACHYEGQIYVYGGRDGHKTLKDFWRYDISSNIWARLECGGDTPPPLHEHTMIGQRGCLFIFGGELGYGSCGETPLWIYSISRQTWEKPVIESEVKTPVGVRGHTAVVWQGGMHVYGGYVDLKGSSGELWTLDFESRWWHLSVDAHVENSPSPRHCHSAVVHDSNMWIYGGLNNLQPLRDLWKWSFESRQWTRVKSYGSPGSLHGHSAVRVANSMMIFGGEGKEEYKNELWKFSFDSISWHSTLPNRKITPTPCTRHVMLSIPNYTLGTYLGIPSADDFRPHSAPNKAYPDRNQVGGASTPFGHIEHLFVMRPHSSPPCVISNDPEQKDGEQLLHRFRNRVHPSPTDPIGPKRELFKDQDDTESYQIDGEFEDEDEQLVALATDDARLYSDPVRRETVKWAITSSTARLTEYELPKRDTSPLLINEESPIHHHQDGRWAYQDEMEITDDAPSYLFERDGEWTLEDVSEPTSPVATRRPSENITLTLTSDSSVNILCTSNPLELSNQVKVVSESSSCNNQSAIKQKYTSLPNDTSYSKSNLSQRLINNDLDTHAGCNNDNNIYNYNSLSATKQEKLPSIQDPERKEAILERTRAHGEGDIISVKPLQENLPENEETLSVDRLSERRKLLASDTNLLGSYVNVGYESSHEDIYCDSKSVEPSDKVCESKLYTQNRLIRSGAFNKSQSPTHIVNGTGSQSDSSYQPVNQSQGRLYYQQNRPSTLLDRDHRYQDQTYGRQESKPRLHGRSQTLNSLPYRHSPDLDTPKNTASLALRTQEQQPTEQPYEEEQEIWQWPVFLYLMGGEETGSCSLVQNTSPMSVWKCCIVQGKVTDSEVQHILSKY